MKIKEKSVISMWCVIVLVVVACFFQSPIVHAEDNTIKNVTLDTNAYKVFKVNNPSNKVEWNVSQKGYINIIEVQGEKNNCIVVKTGSKSGTCVLKAKVEKKIYSWKIKVKKDKKNSKATLEKVQKTDTGLNVTIKLSNRTKEGKEYGLTFSVERLENGCWKKLKMKEDYDIELIAKNIPPQGSAKEIYKLAKGYNFEDLKEGIYRISVDVDFDKKSYSKVLFSVK